MTYGQRKSSVFGMTNSADATIKRTEKRSANYKSHINPVVMVVFTRNRVDSVSKSTRDRVLPIMLMFVTRLLARNRR